ncbi:MOSC domain-containing protein [Salinibaculum salinum]|uniref:MOSC domain-containing protein n=1 Tax=Salinibaculum salinum TaxID=3131996 RepID=UPI0030EB2676
MEVEAIYVAEAGGEPMERRGSIRAVDGGLDGDRYCTGRGYYSPFDVCQVTFVQAEALETIEDQTRLDVTDGQHRRNVVVRGGDVHDLLNHRFSLGSVTFEGTRPRPPCRHVEQVAGQDGLMRALADGNGGICARVAEPGEFAVGDEVHDVEDLGNFESLVSNIRDRVGR